MQTNINVQALTVEAILQQNPERIYQAAMLDPHTAAELDLDQIWSLVNDLLAAHGEWIPETLRTTSGGTGSSDRPVVGSESGAQRLVST
jgi:alpha-galactosidase